MKAYRRKSAQYSQKQRFNYENYWAWNAFYCDLRHHFKVLLSPIMHCMLRRDTHFFCVLLTVHPNIMMVFFTTLMHKFFILIHLLRSSTCFEHYYAHLQEDSCISTASGIVTAFGWLFSTQSSRNLCTEQSPKDSDDTRCCTNTIVLLKVTSPPVTCVLSSHLKTVTIPDALLIQLSSWRLLVLP